MQLCLNIPKKSMLNYLFDIINKVIVFCENNIMYLIMQIQRKDISLSSVFSMSKLPQKHVANQWVNSWDMLEAKNIKF